MKRGDYAGSSCSNTLSYSKYSSCSEKDISECTGGEMFGPGGGRISSVIIGSCSISGSRSISGYGSFSGSISVLASNSVTRGFIVTLFYFVRGLIESGLYQVKSLFLGHCTL